MRVVQYEEALNVFSLLPMNISNLLSAMTKL